MKSKKLSFIINSIKFLFVIKNTQEISFIFPFYSLGGGEQVHLDILNSLKNLNKTCFITMKSKDDFYLKEFKKESTLIEISNLIIAKYEIFFLKILANKINKFKNPKVFGCNNHFFYNLIPYLNEKVKIYDLTHAFSPEEDLPFEKFSLKHVYRINKRIILGEKTFKDFEKLYTENGIDNIYLKRIKIIPNKVEVSKELIKDYNKRFRVLFVGRNSFEKRPELFLQIAKECNLRNLPFEFSLVGNFDKNLKVESNVNVLGVVDNKIQLNNIYCEHHVILNTSTREGLPLTLLEAMASGVVPICTNVGEIFSIVKENITGFIIEDLSIPKWFEFWKKNYKTIKWKVELPLFECAEIEETKNLFIKKLVFLNENRQYLQLISKNCYNLIREKYKKEQFENSYQNLFLD